MLPYGKVHAMQEQRVAHFADEQERAAARKRSAKREPGGLSELLNALAQGMVGIGLRGSGGNRPARPAY